MKILKCDRCKCEVKKMEELNRLGHWYGVYEGVELCTGCLLKLENAIERSDNVWNEHQRTERLIVIGKVMNVVPKGARVSWLKYWVLLIPGGIYTVFTTIILLSWMRYAETMYPVLIPVQVVASLIFGGFMWHNRAKVG